MLYAAGEGGVFRSLDGGVSWGLFPDGAILADGSNNPDALLNSPLGQGGGLPNAIVTDLDLTLGIIDPVTGRAAAVTSGVQAPNLLTASTFGRGTYAIRLAPIVFPNTAANPAILRLSPTSPPPIGSDSGASSADGYTNVTNPVIEGLSEQSAFGNVVQIDVYDVSDYTPAEIAAVLAGRPTRPLGSSLNLVAGTQNTTSTGRFSAQIAPGHFIPYTNNATPNSDGFKKLLVQATNGSGTKGNFAALNFTLDTTPPAALVDGRTPAPGSPAPDLSPPLMDRPDLIAASDSGFSSSDNITNVTTNLTFTIPLAINEPSVTRVYLVRDSDSTIVDSQTGVAFPGTITLRDAGPVTEGTHTYYTYQEDLAGNRGPYSEKLTVRIDTTAPARPAAPVLSPSLPAPGGSDSNIVGDNITNVTLPYLTGLAEAGALVQIIDAGGNVLGPLLADAPNVPSNGIYSVRVVDPFIDGTYPLRVRVLDVAGNISETSVPLTVTILSAALAKPSLVLVAADDSGEVGDNITNVTRPRLVGVATPGLNVQLVLVSSTVAFPGGVLPGGVITPTGSQTPVVVRPDGSFLLQFPTALPSGTYVVRARVSDIAANQEFSDNLTLQILTGSNPGDPNPPAGSPGQPTFALLPADDTGIKGDNVTVSRRPRFVGNAYFADGSLAPNAVVELRTTAGQLLAVTTSIANGSYVLNLPNDLVNGRIDLQARIRDVAGNPGPGSTPVTLRIVSVEGDADADSLADLESFSRINSRFTLTNSNSPTVTTSPFLTRQGDIPFQGDFDGDGRTDFGFYRFGTGQWFVQQSRAGQAVFQFGLAGVDLPVQADYDGDGRTDFATWRQSDGTWTIFRSQTGTLTTAKFGVPGLDQPITGDFDGDRKTDLAVYRTSTGEWLASLSSGAASIPGTFLPPTSALPVPHTTWGIPNVSVPVTADYDGDGRTDLGVYVPALGTWYVARTTGGQQAIPLGQPNVDIPVPADYDGDGRADFAVFRPTDASWLILGSSSPGRITTSGQVGDVPLLAPLQPYRYQPRSTAVVAARGVAVATGGSDFSTSATGGAIASTSTGVDLGGTAAKFAAGGNTGKANANLAVRQRPRQTIQSQANAVSAAKANAHEGVVAQNSLYIAAMQKLGYLKVRFRKDV